MPRQVNAHKTTARVLFGPHAIHLISCLIHRRPPAVQSVSFLFGSNTAPAPCFSRFIDKIRLKTRGGSTSCSFCENSLPQVIKPEYQGVPHCTTYVFQIVTVILHTSLDFMFNYLRYRSTVEKLITVDVSPYTESNEHKSQWCIQDTKKKYLHYTAVHFSTLVYKDNARWSTSSSLVS